MYYNDLNIQNTIRYRYDCHVVCRCVIERINTI